MRNSWIQFSLDDVELWTLNSPYNCYTLNLSKNPEVLENGVKQIFFDFPLLENKSMEILLKGASMISSREIKTHKFYSSGADIKLEKLGKTIFQKESEK